MKKLAYTLLISTALFTACKGSTSKTGGDAVDSGTTHGSSGPSDTSMAAGSGSPVGTSTGGTDTSTTGN